MKKNSMRLLGFLLMAMMMVSLFAVGVFAEDTANVAKVGDTEYATLQKAIDAASPYDTVTLLAAVSENVTVSKTLTLDGAGNDYTGTMTAKDGLTVTVQNVNFVNGGFTKTTSGSGTYTIKDSTFDGKGQYAYAVRFRGTNANVSIENCTVKDYLYSFLYISHSTKTVSVKNVTVDNCPSYAVYFASGVTTATFENLTVKNSNNGFLINNAAKRAFTIKDCRMEGVTNAINHAGGTNTITCTVFGDNDFGTAADNQYAKYVLKEDASLLFANASAESVGAVAKIGAAYYATLSDAVADAQSKDTITLLANVTENIEFGDKAIILNLNGKTLNGHILASSNAKLIVQNGSIINADKNYSAIEINEGYLHLVDVTVKSARHAIRIDGEVEAVIESGEFVCANGEGTGTYHALNVSGKASVRVTGGTFTGPKGTVSDSGAAVNAQSGSKIYISGGSFSGGKRNTLAAAGTIEVTGGTYDQDPSAYLAKGYMTLQNAEGQYIVTKAAASANGVNYATLADALEATKDQKDIVIDLLADATLDIAAWQTLAIGGETTETITINGNGKTLTFHKLDSDWDHVATNNDAKLILNNMTITDSGYNNGPWNRYDLNFACDVELNDVTATKALAFKADAALKNVTVNEVGDNYAIWIQANGQKVTIDGLTVTSAGRGIKISEEYVDAPAKVELAVSNATFTTAKKAAVLVGSKAGATITASNVDITNVQQDSVNIAWVDEDWAAHYGKVTVIGGTLAQESAADFKAALTDNGAVLGYYKTLQAAIDACVVGKNTVTLLDDCAEDVTIKQTEGVNIVIDGAYKTFSGTMYIHGGSRHTGAETLTIKKVLFSTDKDAHDFISSNSTASAERYAHNVTVDNCRFVATAADNSVVGLRFRQSYNIRVSRCQAEGLHSLLWATGVSGLKLEGNRVQNGANGISVGTSSNVQVVDNEFNVSGYGIRADGSATSDLTVMASSITAAQPIIIRNATGTFTLNLNTFKGNTLVPTTEGGYQVIVTAGADDAAYTEPTGAYTLNGADALNVFPTDAYVASVNGKNYLSLADAFAAAVDGDEVLILKAGTYALSTSGADITITGTVDGVVFDNIGTKNMGGANVTFNNVTFDYYPNVHYTGLQHSGNLVYNNCTINGQVFLYGQSETFNNCTFNQNSADAYNVWTYGGKEVAFNECTFNSVGKSVLIYKEGDDASFKTNVAVTDCDFIASAPAVDKAAIEMDSSLIAGIKLTVNNADVTGFGTGNVSKNSLWNNKKGNEGANNDITVIVDGVTVLAPLSATINHGLQTVVNAEGRESVTFTLLDVSALKELKVELWSNGEPISTTVYSKGGLFSSVITVNIVVKGSSSSWTTEWLVAPSVDNIPDEIRVYADGMLVDTMVGEDSVFLEKYESELAEYVALSGVYKAASVTDTAGNVRYYGTLSAAIAAVQNGETITFLDDIDEDVTIKQTANNSFTIDGADYKYYGTININGNRRSSGTETLTIKNVNFVAEGQWQSSIFAVKNTYVHNLTVDGCTFTGTDAKQAYGIRLHHSYNIVVKNTTGTKLYELVYGNTAVSGFIAENVTVTDSTNGIYLAYVNSTATFTNVDITANRVGIGFVSNAAGTATIEGCEINALYPVYVNENGQAKAPKLVFKGENVLTGNENWLTISIDDNKVGGKVVVNLADSDLDISKVAYDKNYYATYATATEKVYEIKNDGRAAAIGSITYPTLQAAIDAAKDGDTVTLLADLDEDVTVVQKDGVSIVIDGAGKTFSGTIYIHGGSRYQGTETLTIKNFKFTTDEAAHDFISSNSTASAERYAHNVLVDKCSFTATAADNSVVGLRFRQSYNIRVSRCEAENIHSLLWATGVSGLELMACNADTQNGISVGTSTGVVIEGCEITAESYGIRADGSATSDLTVKASNIKAAQPIIIRNATGTFTLNLDTLKVNTLVPTTEGDYQVIVTDGSDDAAYTEPTGTYVLNGTGGLKVYPVSDYVASVNGKGYFTLQAAIDACQVGDNVITLLKNIKGEDVTIKQTEGVNIVIDGTYFAGITESRRTFDGTIYIHGNARYTGAETLTFKFISFVTDKAGHYFIDSNSTGSVERYAHNVTVEDCTFTATGDAVNSAVAMRIRQGFNITVKAEGIARVTANGMHSLLQAYGCAGVTVSNVNLRSVKNGISLGTSTNVKITNSAITATGYGIRADGTGAYDMTVAGSTITAAQPIIVRKATGAYKVTLGAGNKLTATSADGYQVILTNDSDDVAYANPTGAFELTGAEGLKVYPVSDYVAMIGTKGFLSLQEAINAVQNGETITFLVDIDEDVTIKQTDGFSFTIDGADYKYYGTININGNKRSSGAETLTIKNVNFVAEGQWQSSIFAVKSTYVHNLTVDGCTFTGTDAKQAYGIRLHHSYNIVVKNTTGTKLFDLVYGNTALTGFIAENVTVTDSTNGFILSYVNTDAIFTNVKVTAKEVGFGFVSNIGKNIVFNGCYANAANPVFVNENASAATMNLTFTGTNEFVGNDNWLTINRPETVQGGKVIVNLVDSDLDIAKVAYDKSYYATYTTETEKVYEIKNDSRAAAIGSITYPTLEAAIAAVKNGETIVLLANCDEDVTIKQVKNVSFTIDGADYQYTGTIKVNGNRRSTGAETLTIKNVNFVQDTASQIFIEAVSGSYTHNVTVDGCTFTGTDKTAFGMKIPNSYNIVIKNSTGTGLLELGYSNKAVTGFTAENVTVTDSVNGFYLSYAMKVSIKNATLDVTNIGVYVNNYNASTATIEDCTITAPNPVVIEQKNATNAYNLVFNGTNDFGDGNWLTVVGSDAKFTVTVNDNGLDMNKTTGLVAGIDNVYYNRQADVLAVAEAGDTIDVLKTLVFDTDYELKDLTIKTDVVNPAIRVTNGATLTVTDMTFDTAAYAFILGASDGSSEGNVIINSGSFESVTSVASVTKGTLTVLGGEFKTTGAQYGATYLLNCVDDNYRDGSAQIIVKGGTFYGFDPANSASENPKANFVADGYRSVDNGDGSWTVKKLITVIMDDVTMTYGDEVPKFTYTYTGAYENDEFLLVMDIADIVNPDAGKHTITASGYVFFRDDYVVEVTPGTLTVEKATITVTMDNVSKIYGQADPNFSYTCTTDYDGEFMLVVPQTREEGEDAGTYEIAPEAYVFFNDNFNVVVIPGELTIEKATVTVTMDDVSKVYGQADPNFSYTFTTNYDGEFMLVVPQTRVEGEDAGTYEIAPEAYVFFNDNFNVEVIPGELTIEKATVTVTMDNVSKVYGQADPNFSFTYTTNYDGEFMLVVPQTRDEGENAGTYEIAPEAYVFFNDNFNVVVIPGTLTIEKAKITVTFDDLTVVFGNEINYTYTTDFTDVAIDGTMLVVDTPVVNVTGAGEYEITANAYVFMNDNYVVEVVSGKLTVMGAILSVDGVYFTGWADAKDSIKKDSVIVLYADVEYGAGNVEYKFPSSAGNITIDLNGNDLTFHYTVTVMGNTTVTVGDSSADKTGTLSNTRNAYPFVIAPKATLNLVDGVGFNCSLQFNVANGITGLFQVNGENVIGETDSLFATSDESYLRVVLKDHFMQVTVLNGALTQVEDVKTLALQTVTLNAGTRLTVSKGATLTIDPSTTLVLNGTLDGEGTVVVSTLEHLKQIMATDIRNIEIAATIEISEDFELDLLGKNITTAAGVEPTFHVTSGAEMTIVDSTIDEAARAYDDAGNLFGRFAVDADSALNIYAGIYNYNVNEFCADHYLARDNHNGTWTVVRGYVFNKTHGVSFLTIADAVANAMTTEGEDYLMLLENHEEFLVTILDGVTLDLQSYTLTAQYVFGTKGAYLIGAAPDKNGNGGARLIAPKAHVALGADAFVNEKGYSIIQVWDKDQNAYVFSLANINMDSNAATGNERGFFLEEKNGVLMMTAKFKLQLSTGVINTIMADGQASHGVQVLVTASWMTPDGLITQTAHFTDEYVMSTYVKDSNGVTHDFVASVVIAGHTDLVMTVQVVTATGIVLSSETAYATPLVTAWAAANE